MHVGRLHRVLKILTLLQGGCPRNARELAAECGVSRRTVHRDLSVIEQAGIPFFYDRDADGYRLHHSALLPAINLTLDEALALVALATELGRPGGIPLLQPARDAALKIESALPLAVRAAVGSTLRRMAVRPAAPARHASLQQTYEQVRRAVARDESLDCVYISFHDKGQIRTRLDPYWLLFSERAWYVIGRSSRHRAVRTFKLGRFRTVEPAGRHFRRPGNPTLEGHLGNAWRLMRGDTTYRVHLVFSPLVSPNVAEVVWHRTQTVRWDDDGSVHFEATVDGLDEIVWWVLGYGPHVRVVDPPELRDRLVAMTRATLAQYVPT